MFVLVCLTYTVSLCPQVMCVGKDEPLKPSWHRPLTSPPLSNRYSYSIISIIRPTGSEDQLCPGLLLDSIEVVGERRTLAKLSWTAPLTLCTRLWTPWAAQSAADSYSHGVRRSDTADHSSSQSLLTHLFFVNVLFFSIYILLNVMFMFVRFVFLYLLHLELL